MQDSKDINVWDVIQNDGEEKSSQEIIGNAVAMTIAIGLVVLSIPFLPFVGIALIWRNRNEMVAPLTKPTLP